MGSNRVRRQQREEQKQSRRTTGHDASNAKDKYKEQREEFVRANKITPMNKKQASYLHALQDPDISVIVATGHAGTSKTFIPTAFSCLEYLQNRVYKIAFSRPAISNSKSLGFFAGDKNEKMSIWLAPVLSTVKQYLNSGVTEIAIKKEDIVFYPLEIIKGLSLGSTVEGRRMFFIVDEAEDLTIDEVKKIITRVGKNCTLVLAGDITQSELKENSGLKWLINFYGKHDLKGFYHVDFNDVNDIVRSDTVKSFITALQRETKTKKEETNNNGTNSKTNS